MAILKTKEGVRMAIRKEILDELLENYKGPDDLIGENGLLKELTKALIETALQAELSESLGYKKGDRSEKMTENRRNGATNKTIRTDQGPIELEIPRDRKGEFEPVIIPKHQRDFKGFDEKILSMYSRGMSTREIADHLKEIYNIEVSAEFITNVTDRVVGFLEEWRNRELEAVYPIVFLDAIVTNIRDGSHVTRKSIYLALAITLEGKKELLGLWIEQNEGAKFWLGILNELKNRGVKDILIAAVDGLSGFPQAINTVFPKTQIQLCIVHMIRNSMRYVARKEWRIMAADLRKVYTSPTEDAALTALNDFGAKWDNRYSVITKIWRSRWAEIVPFLAYPPEIRKIMYTTNAIESFNFTLKKVMKNKLSFPTSESAMKLIFMALQNISKRWTLPVMDWNAALNQFAIMFEGRLPV
jgi:putative transposase